MRRIVIAIASTITGLVLLFSWPTSLNRSVTLASGSTGAGADTATGTTESSESTEGSTEDDGDAASEDSTTTDGSTGTSGTGSGTSSGTADSGTSGSTGTTSGTFVGDAVSTRYGDVQVQITVTDGVITSAEAVSYPYRDRHDQQINDYAIPILQDETVQANSADIAMVSGATVTSRGYVQSLQSAIDQAGL